MYTFNKINCLLFCIVTAILLLLSSTSPSLGYGKTKLNVVDKVTYSKNLNSEKITILMHKAASYKSRFLNHNPKAKKPYRLYIDLINTSISTKVQHIIKPKSPAVSRVRIGQRNKNTTRIVLDIKKKIYRDDYEITQLDNPSRIILELYPQKTRSAIRGASSPQKTPPLDIPPATRVQEEIPGVRTPAQEGQTSPLKKADDRCIIVIDPGHGGKDPGAIGFNGIKEKDVCLAVSLNLKKILDANFNCRTILTRKSDKFVSLDDRGKIANDLNADLFISIHANSHKDTKLTGIETYYLNFSSDDNARLVAARENFTTPAEISDLEMILFDLLQSDKINKSSIFAGYVHNAMVQHLSKKYKNLRNLGIKHAPMRVLINPEMPCLLIETAFISNPVEAKRLKNGNYQTLLSQAILQGIKDFTHEQRTAFYNSSR